jgi:hypothetical protein
MPATGEGTNVAPVDPQQSPEAIVLDLMNPAITPGGSAERMGTWEQ